MADKQVETKVVQVRFDNSKFSKNINKTIKECEKFDKSLQFKSSKNNIKDIQKALDDIELKQLNSELDDTNKSLNKLTISFKDLLKIKLLSKAMDVVISKTNAMIKSMLGIHNVVAGWQQYETQMTNVGGILNQVQDKGYGLEDVASAMERLRWYTDETSYSFTTLSNGIRQFVIAGIDLNKAAEAAMGVTNLAGSAKVFDEYKIQSAMDAVSKAMQTGYMDVQKWTSLTNTAGIVTEDFSNLLLEEAAAQGKLVKSAAGQYKTKKSGKLVTTENIRSTLSDKWLSADVLANVMDRYASASTAVETFSGLMAEQTDENLAKINSMFEKSGVQFESFDEILTKMPNDVEDATELTAEETGRFLESLGYGFDEVSYKAFKSAQETTSFSQSLTYVRKAISTQWANIFEKIFGDYQTSTKLWSDISGKFYRIFVMPFENLTSVFDNWSTLTEGGAEDFRNMVKTIIDIVGKFKDAVSSGFRAVFGSIDENWLKKITLGLKGFFDKISEGLSVIKDEVGNEKENPLYKMIKALSKILASVIKIIGKIQGTVIKILGKVFVALEPVFEIVADLLDMVADGLIWVINMVDELGILDFVVEGVAKALTWVANGIKNVITWIKGKIDLEKVTNKLAKAFNYLKIAIEWVIDKFKEAGTAVRDWWNENEIAQKTINFFKTALEKTKGAFTGFNKSTKDSSDSVDEFSESLENVSDAGDKMSNKLTWVDKLKAFFKTIGNFFKNVFISFKTFLEDKGILSGLKSFFSGLKSVFEPIINMIVGWWKQLGELAKKDPTEAMKKLAKAIAIIIGIFLMLKVAGFMRAGTDTLWECYYTLKAFKKKLLAERWKALATAVLILSVSVLILTYTMERIAKIPTTDAWKAMGIVGAIIASYALLLAMMNSPLFKASIKAGLSMTLQLQAMSIGLALFLSGFKKALKIVSNYSQGDIWKAYGLIAAMTGLLIFISISLFRKVNKTGLFKGEFIKGPSFMMLLKTFLFVYTMFKLVFWFIDKIEEYDTSTLKRAGITIATIIGGVVVLMSSIKLLGLIARKKTGVEKITNQWVKVNIGSLAIVAIATYYVMTKVSKMSMSEIGHGVLALISIFGAIGIVLLAVGAMNRIANGKEGRNVGVKLGKTMISIALAAILCITAFKMINKTPIGEVWKGGLFIIALYTIIGVIAALLTKVSKTVEMTIGKDGIKKVGAKSPIGGLIIGISGLVLVFMLGLKLLNKMEWEDFIDGIKKLSIVIGIVAGVSLLILLASKVANGKAIIQATVSLFAGVITAIGVAIALKYINPEDMWIGYGIITAFGAFLLAFMAIIGVINKYLKSSISNAKTFAIYTIALMASVWAMLGAIVFINKQFGEEGKKINWALTLSVLGVCITVIVGLVAGIMFIAKKVKGISSANRKTLFSIMACVAIAVGLIYAMVGLVAIASAIPTNKVWRSMAIVGICTGAVIVLIAAILGVTFALKKMGKNTKDIVKDTFKITVMVLGLSLAIGIIIDAIAVVSTLNSSGAWRGLKIVGIITAGLIAVLSILMILIKVFKMADISPLLMLSIAALMISIGAAILLVAFAIGMIADAVSNDYEAFKVAAITVAIIAAVLTAIVIAVMLMASKFNEGQKSFLTILAVAILMLSIGGAILMIAKALQMVSVIPTEDLIKAAVAIGILAIVFGAIVLLLGKFMEASPGTLLGGMAIMLSLAVSVLAIALALQMISNIGLVGLAESIGALVVVLTVLTGFVGILGALAMSGIGVAGAAMLLAISAACLILAAALWLIADAINRSADAIIKLMNEASPEKNKNLKELGKSLMVLAAGTIANGLADFGAALLGVGSSLANFVSSIVNLGSSLVDAISTIVDAFSSWLSSKKEKRETALLERKAAATEKYANACKLLDEINADSISDKIETISDAIKDASLANGIFDKTGESLIKEYINNLYELKSLLEDMPDPVITPILDLTEFNKGMAEIQNGNYNIRASLYNNYTPVASMPSITAIRNDNARRDGGNIAEAKGIGTKANAVTINQEFMLTDAMAYSYDTQRATANAIAASTKSTF